jgi:hypothetical protein
VAFAEQRQSQQGREPFRRIEGRQRALILAFIESRSEGTTLCDIQRKFGWEKNAFSGRLTELMDARKLYIFGPRREKCAV